MGLSPNAAYCRTIGTYNNTTSHVPKKQKFTQRAVRHNENEQALFRCTELAHLIRIHNHIIENNNIAMTYHRRSRAEAILAALSLLSMVRISDFYLPSVRGTTAAIPDVGCDENAMARQSIAQISLAREPGWLTATLQQWLPDIRDPLRFPAAGAVELSTVMPPSPAATLHGNHHDSAAGESKTGIRQSVAEFFSRYAGYTDSSINDDKLHLVNSAINAISNDPDITMALAELLNPLLFTLKNSEADARQITEPVSIINGWIEREIFDDSVFDFVVRHAIEHRGDDNYNFNLIKSALTKQINNALNNNTDFEHEPIKNYIFNKIVAEEFPQYNAGIATLWGSDSTNWGINHAGLSFAALLGADIQNINNDEAHAIGVMICNLLNEDASISELVRLFSLPAILSYIHDYPEKIVNWTPEIRQEIEEAALKTYFSRHNKLLFENHPQLIFVQSIKNFKSRIELLEDGREYNKEKLDESFYQQNQDIADKFQVVDKILITTGFDGMDEREREFIDSSEITFGKFALVKTWETSKNTGVFPAMSHDKNRLTVIDNPANIDIFLARNGDNSRIYALHGIEGRYQVSRVDHDPEKYYNLLPESNKDVPVEGFTLELVYNQNDIIVATQWVSDRLVHRLANHHKDILRKQLDLAGYDNTLMEKVKKILLSLVPLYDCFTAASKGEGGEALFSCGLDSLSIIPVLGQASKISASATRVLGQGLQSAGMNALRKTSTAQGTQHMAKVALSEFYQSVNVPLFKIVSSKQTTALALALLKGFDPGIGPSYTLLKNACRRAYVKAEPLIKAISNLDTAFPKLNRLKPGGANTNGLSQTDPLVVPNSNGQAVIMRMEAGGADAVPSVIRPTVTGPLQPFVWRTYTEFMPLYRHGHVPSDYMRKQIADILSHTFHNKPYLAVKGLKGGPNSNKYPYLREAQSVTRFALERCFEEINEAKIFLQAALRNQEKNKLINEYFAKEMGISLISRHDITRQMINITDDIITKILLLKNKIKNNIHFASTKRTLDVQGNYPSSLTMPELTRGSNAFCLAGDQQNRLYIIVDRFMVSQEYPDVLSHVLTHEMSHLAAQTEDIYYINHYTSTTLGEGELLKIFEDKMTTKTMNLRNLKLKINHHYNLPLTTHIDDDVIYSALRDDLMFKANVMMLNADNIVNFIRDIARMGHAARTTRSAEPHEQRDRFIDRALLALLVKTSLNAESVSGAGHNQPSVAP